MSLTVSVIVPAFNEEKRIRNVLEFLAKSDIPNEVICVDDGSTDKTNRIIHAVSGITCVDLPENKGKANAIVEGILVAKSDIVLFIDADLSGMTDDVLRALVDPLASGSYDVAIAYPAMVEIILLFRPLTGERGYFRKDLLPHLEALRNKGYRLELALNHLFCNKRIKITQVAGVTQLHKEGKYKLSTAVRREAGAWKELIGEVLEQEKPLQFTYEAYLKHYYIPTNRRQ